MLKTPNKLTKLKIFKPKKPKPLSGEKLTKALDDAIRELYHLKYPHPICFVCKKPSGWFHPTREPKGCQIGHFVSRKYYPLRWDVLNLWSQCAKCNWEHSNRMFGTNPTPFAIAIVREYGVERLEYLQNKKNGPSPSTIEKRELLSTLQEQILALQAECKPL